MLSWSRIVETGDFSQGDITSPNFPDRVWHLFWSHTSRQFHPQKRNHPSWYMMYRTSNWRSWTVSSPSSVRLQNIWTVSPSSSGVDVWTVSSYCPESQRDVERNYRYETQQLFCSESPMIRCWYLRQNTYTTLIYKVQVSALFCSTLDQTHKFQHRIEVARLQPVIRNERTKKNNQKRKSEDWRWVVDYTSILFSFKTAGFDTLGSERESPKENGAETIWRDRGQRQWNRVSKPRSPLPE